MTDLDRREFAFKGYPLGRRTASTTTSFARLKVWHYTKQNFGTPSNVRGSFSSSTIYDVVEDEYENDLFSVKINKEIGRPSATFDVVLLPTQNWKKFIAPGDWIEISLFNRRTKSENTFSTKNVVLLGNVDRVSRSLQRNENDDKVELRYRISGRNFGKVLEETDIWFDPYTLQAKTADTILRQAGIPLQGSPDKMFGKVLDVFLGKGIITPKGSTGELKQWRMPWPVINRFDTSSIGTKLDNILQRNIESGLPGYRTRVMLNSEGNGNLWEQLEQASNKLINEVIVEESRDGDGVKPSITLRPRPFNTVFFQSQFGGEMNLYGALKGKWKTLQDMAKEDFIEISPKEVIYEDLGRDDHSRLNMFNLSSETSYDHVSHIRANKNKKSGIGMPLMARESVHRHGLKRFDGRIDFPFANERVKEASGSSDLFKAFLVQLYDMNYANHLYEQGTMECTGVLEAELGKALVVKDSYSGLDKVYYIEGYEHEWTFPGTWRTIFTLTKGQFLTSGLNVYIDIDSDDFGQEDKRVSATYVAQSQTER